MFWKKKKTETQKITEPDPGNQREAFRYIFDETSGPEILFKGEIIRILNISAGGLAFANHNFTPLDYDHIRIELDIPDCNQDTAFDAGLRILKIDEDNICHCIFEGCSLEQHELLHKYVLEMQKRDLAH